MKQTRILLWTCFVILLISAGTIVYFFAKGDIPKRIADTIRTDTMQEINGTYRVVNVSDGDTIEVDMNGVVERIRFIGIDTPETHKPGTPVQCYGTEATNYLQERLKNSRVRLESDPLSSNRDRYDRLLRYVYVGDSLLNYDIVNTGNGFAYTPFEFSKRDEFLGAELAAKSGQRGLWGMCDIETENGVYQTIYR